MKRKSLFLALGASLCLSLFITACGSSASSSTAATAAAAESAETESSDTAAAESGGAPGMPRERLAMPPPGKSLRGIRRMARAAGSRVVAAVQTP